MRAHVKRLLHSGLHTRVGHRAISAMIAATKFRVFAPRTATLMQFDAMRLKTRIAGNGSPPAPAETQLHFGCGSIRVKGFLNVDVADSEFDVDLASGRLPWADGVFSAIVSEHVVEHLELETEFLPLLRELRRISWSGAEIWLSCPDMEKTCAGYLSDKGAALLADMRRQRPLMTFPEGCPPQHIVNKLFHQNGEHKNLYDLELLEWAMKTAGFAAIRRVEEHDLLTRFPEFPAREDDFCTIYVRGIAS